MKAHTSHSSIRYLSAMLALATLALLGCATTKRVDWNSRVGSYLYDQAITELGPPDKQEKLSDGRTVAQWITRRSGGSSLGIGTGIYGGHSGVGLGQSIGSGPHDQFLRLTFGVDGRLAAWTKN